MKNKDIYFEILNNNERKLNLRAMKFFVKNEMWLEAAICRDKVGYWYPEEYKKIKV